MIIVPKVSYSLLASYGKFADLKDALLAVSAIGIDMIHYDVSEEKKTLSLEELPHLRQFTKLPIDVHLCVKDPAPLIARTKMEPRDFFCIHVENARPLAELRQFREHLGCAFGLAINVDTPVEALEYAIPEISFVLFMAAVPGVSGGSFNESVIDKIQTFKKRHPKIKIHVDGGINNYSAALLRGIGINVMISGSYVLNDNNYSNQVARLVGQNLNLPLSELMHAGADLPAVREEASIGEVAREIDAKGIGCTTIVGERHRFLGLVTDTDIRHFVMAHESGRGATAREVMNPRPFTVAPDRSLISLLRELEERGLFFTVVPVVAEDGTCVGILRLQDILFRNVLGLRIRYF